MSIYLSNSSYADPINEPDTIVAHDVNFHENVFSNNNLIARRAFSQKELSCNKKLIISASTSSVCKGDDLVLRENSRITNAVAKSLLFGYESHIERASSPSIILTDCTSTHLVASKSLQLISSKVSENITAHEESNVFIVQSQVEGFFYCFAKKVVIKDSSIKTLILPKNAKLPEIINSKISRILFRKA